MRAYFLPLNFTQSLYMRSQTIQQGNRSIDEYTEESHHHVIAMNDVSEMNN